MLSSFGSWDLIYPTAFDHHGPTCSALTYALAQRFIHTERPSSTTSLKDRFSQQLDPHDLNTNARKRIKIGTRTANNFSDTAACTANNIGTCTPSTATRPQFGPRPQLARTPRTTSRSTRTYHTAFYMHPRDHMLGAYNTYNSMQRRSYPRPHAAPHALNIGTCTANASPTTSAALPPAHAHHVLHQHLVAILTCTVSSGPHRVLPRLPVHA